MYKAIYSKDFRKGISIGTFPRTAKRGEWGKVYRTGFHHWRESNGCHTWSLVIWCFRIILTLPGKGGIVGECQG